MTRMSKALGLALLAVLAISAVAASGAQAEPTFTGFETGPEGQHEYTHTIITGELPAEAEPNKFYPTREGFGGAVECESTHFHGTSETGDSSTLTVLSTSENCTAQGGRPIHVRMNGCHYTLHVETKIKEDTYEGTADVVCDTEGLPSIELEVTETPGLAGHCIDTIPPQKGIGPIYFHNDTESNPTEVTVVAGAENVVNKTLNGLLDCGVSKGEHATGVYEGEATVRGFNTNEEQIDIEVGGE